MAGTSGWNPWIARWSRVYVIKSKKKIEENGTRGVGNLSLQRQAVGFGAKGMPWVACVDCPMR